MSDLVTRSRSLVTEAASKLDPVEFLKRSVREMDDESLRELAVAYLLSQLRMRRRAGVRVIERDATVQAPLSPERQAEIERNRAAWDARREQDDREHEARMAAITADMFKAFDRYKEALRVEWTRDLLAAEFAVGDGTTTTWGFATVEQHEARIAMHKRNAVAGMEGAARHMQAVEMLRETGAPCLNEVMKVAA